MNEFGGGGNSQLVVQALQNIAQAINAAVMEISGVLPDVDVSTFANLPSSPAEGMLRGVSDSNTNTWGATVAGGGSNHVLVYYNGTNWTVAAK